MRKYFTHDPENYDFSDKDLPALYLFRTNSVFSKDFTTDDNTATEDTVKVFWVLPPCQQFQWAARARAMPQIGHVIMAALDRGRDPCFVVAGDPDPRGAVEGSVVLRFAGLAGLRSDKFQIGRIAIAPLARLKSQPIDAGVYDCLQLDITIREVFTEDQDATASPELGPFLPLYVPAAVDATVTVGDETAEFRDPP